MNPTDIAVVLQAIEDKLGPLAQQAWAIAARQVQVYIVMDIVVGLLVLGVFALGGNWCLRRGAVDDDDGWYSNEMWSVVGALIWFLGGLICLSHLIDAGTAMANPEWQTIKLLLGD